jgi:serine protease Do
MDGLLLGARTVAEATLSQSCEDFDLCVAKNRMVRIQLMRIALFFLVANFVLGAGAALAAVKTEPVTLESLLKTQRQVQAQLPVVEGAVIALDSTTSAASGVIISPDGLVLTAGHVVQGLMEAGSRDGMCQVVLADGSKVTAKALGRDLATDAGMMQLQGARRSWPYVPLGRSVDAARVGDWCFALGHPGGRDVARGPVLRVGKVLRMSANAVQSDCVLMGGDSGGPLFNLKGQVIGIHSQIWEGRDQNAHVALGAFLRSWDALLKGQVITETESAQVAWLGVATVWHERGGVLVEELAAESPAGAGGLQAGDVILRADDQELREAGDLAKVISCHAAGETVQLSVQRGPSTQEFRVKLATRPTPQP